MTGTAFWTYISENVNGTESVTEKPTQDDTDHACLFPEVDVCLAGEANEIDLAGQPAVVEHVLSLQSVRIQLLSTVSAREAESGRMCDVEERLRR